MKKINKKIGNTMGPKRKPAPKPIVSNKVIARRVPYFDIKSQNIENLSRIGKKQTTSLPTSGSTGSIDPRAKRSTQTKTVPSKFEQKKAKAMDKFKSKAKAKYQRQTIKSIRRTGSPLQNGEELKPIMIKPNMGRMIKPMAKFPDLSGDGKVTKKDILMGRGVIPKPKLNYKK